MKACSKCGEMKPLSEFNRRSASSDGRRSECRDCQRAVQRAYLYERGGREKKRQHAFETREQRREWWRKYSQSPRGKAAIARAIRKRGYSPERGPAHIAVYRAVKSGRLVRPDRCEFCHREGPVEAHHHNGYDPEHYLDVLWACRECHDLIDHDYLIPLARLEESEQLAA